MSCKGCLGIGLAAAHVSQAAPLPQPKKSWSFSAWFSNISWPWTKKPAPINTRTVTTMEPVSNGKGGWTLKVVQVEPEKPFWEKNFSGPLGRPPLPPPKVSVQTKAPKAPEVHVAYTEVPVSYTDQSGNTRWRLERVEATRDHEYMGAFDPNSKRYAKEPEPFKVTPGPALRHKFPSDNDL